MPRYATAAATVPEPVQVFGTPLRPFCLGHHLLFKRLGLPFAGNPLADAGPDDLMPTIAVCANASYESTLDSMHSGEWPEMFARWRKKLEAQKNLDWKRGSELFRAYLMDGYAMPPLWTHQNNGPTVEITAPWECSFKVRLLMVGLSETEILNGYLPCRRYEYHTALEIEQLRNCPDPSKWKKTFYLQQHAEGE